MLKINKKDCTTTEYSFGNPDTEPKSNTLNPITTGASVIALYFNKGVILATDTQISYGRFAQLKDVRRSAKITDFAAFASSGEYSDFQEATILFDNLEQKVRNADDGISYTPKDLANYLARNCYAKRNKMNPLYMSSVVGGYFKGQRYLGAIDPLGTLIEHNYLVTGFSQYLCRPIIEKDWNDTMTEEETKKVIDTCFKVLYYRDCGAFDRIQFTIIDENGVRIEEPYRIETKWDYQLTRERANEKHIKF